VFLLHSPENTKTIINSLASGKHSSFFLLSINDDKPVDVLIQGAV
jgi:hypothetical protein